MTVSDEPVIGIPDESGVRLERNRIEGTEGERPIGKPPETC
ncbi:MAG: hypothetical protein ACREP2_15055 [Rhodanobacteraceae bacterium]